VGGNCVAILRKMCRGHAKSTSATRSKAFNIDAKMQSALNYLYDTLYVGVVARPNYPESKTWDAVPGINGTFHEPITSYNRAATERLFRRAVRFA